MKTNWQIGDKFQDRWEIKDIKRGGTGIVYIVYDHQLQDILAAKTLQDQFIDNQTARTSFNLEGLAWIKLDMHQNIAQARFVHNIEDRPFLFMEYVSGGDLSAWIGTRLTDDLPQVLRFGIQFCDGMHYALSKGIEAHRDIKPQNCLITKDDVLKVTDFGLAKVADTITGITRLSDDVIMRNGELWVRPHEKPLNPAEIKSQQIKKGLLDIQKWGGRSPHYMAPEAFDNVNLVNVQSDIYSFGVMLFQMITGRLPFAARTPEEAVRLHKTGPAPKLESLPPALNEFLQTCLAKEPSHRFENFAQMRKALAKIYKDLTGKSAPQPAKGEKLSADQWLEKGWNLSALGPHEEAVACFDKALALNPRHAGAWSAKGSVLAYVGRYDEALGCLNRALELNPQNKTAWSNMVVTLRGLGKYEEALACMDHALRLDPNNGYMWSNKGSLLDEIGRRDEAVTCFDHALQLDPGHANTWSNKGGTLWELGKHQEALACIERALEVDPRHSGAWTNKGVAMGTMGRHAEALTCFEKALEFDSRNAKAWAVKGLSMAALGRRDEELLCYRRSLEFNPRDKMTWYNYGVALRELGRREEALSCFDRAIEVDAQFANGWFNKAVEERDLGRHENAFHSFDRVTELTPNNADAWYGKGVELGVSLGRYEEAIRAYDRAIALDPRHKSAWNNKGATYSSLGKYREAVECFEMAQRLGHPQAAQRAADCRRMMDEFSRGELTANDIEAEQWISKCFGLVQAQRWQEALACAEKAISLSPRNMNALLNKGAILEKLGRPNESLACINHALTINPRDKTAWYNKGSVLGNLRRFREAMTCFEEAQRLGHLQAAQMVAVCRQMLGLR